MLKIKGKSAVFMEGLTFNTWSHTLKHNLKDLKGLFKVVELFSALERMLIHSFWSWGTVQVFIAFKKN